MSQLHLSFASLSDRQVIAEVERLAGAERKATAHLVAALAELDTRRLYLREGCSSLFAFCTTVLHLSEHAAYGRIEAARAGRKFPLILELLLNGEVTLTTVTLLAPVLTTQNHQKVLAEAAHRSKREVEAIVARLRPSPDVQPTVRKLPVNHAPAHDARAAFAPNPPPAPAPRSTPPPSGVPAVPPPASQRPIVAPLTPERYKVQFTVSRESHDRLRRAQDLLRHSVPDGDIAAVFDRALSALLRELEKSRFAETSRPVKGRPSEPGTRHIPAAVRRAVWKRDGGQCAFRGTRGRCQATGFLEFHHVQPFAAEGEATEDNIELRCRAHNQYEAELYFGDPLIARERPPTFGALSSARGLSVVNAVV